MLQSDPLCKEARNQFWSRELRYRRSYGIPRNSSEQQFILFSTPTSKSASFLLERWQNKKKNTWGLEVIDGIKKKACLATSFERRWELCTPANTFCYCYYCTLARPRLQIHHCPWWWSCQMTVAASSCGSSSSDTYFCLAIPDTRHLGSGRPPANRQTLIKGQNSANGWLSINSTGNLSLSLCVCVCVCVLGRSGVGVGGGGGAGRSGSCVCYDLCSF